MDISIFRYFYIYRRTNYDLVLIITSGSYLRGNSRGDFRNDNGDNPLIALTYTPFFSSNFLVSSNRSANSLLRFDMRIFDLGMDSKENTKSYLFWRIRGITLLKIIWYNERTQKEQGVGSTSLTVVVLQIKVRTL